MTFHAYALLGKIFKNVICECKFAFSTLWANLSDDKNMMVSVVVAVVFRK